MFIGEMASLNAILTNVGVIPLVIPSGMKLIFFSIDKNGLKDSMVGIQKNINEWSICWVMDDLYKNCEHWNSETGSEAIQNYSLISD